MRIHSQAQRVPRRASSAQPSFRSRPFGAASNPLFTPRRASHDFGAVGVRAPETVSAATPIQRTISLIGEDEDRTANVARLNRLLGKSGASVKHEDGKVVFAAHPKNDAGKQHAAYRLLSRVIAHQHEVQLGVNPHKENADPVTNTKMDNATKPGTGSGSVVHMPRVVKQTPITVYNEASNKLLSQDSPDHVQLGHELVHADRAQRGMMTHYDKWTNKQYRGHLTGYGDFNTMASERIEELQTIGLINGDKDAITENQLRHSLGLLPRASNARMESHLVNDHKTKFDQAQREYAALDSTALTHGAKATQSRQAATAANQRMLEMQRQEQQHRQNAADNLEFAQSVRGNHNPAFGGLTWDDLADHHQTRANQALFRANSSALQAAEHRRERDEHVMYYRNHITKYNKAANLVNAKKKEVLEHQNKGNQLRDMLGLGD